MTQKEIIEGNKLICEFMLTDSAFLTEVSGFPAKKLQYHSSWDWLIPVFKKCYILSSDGRKYFKSEMLKYTLGVDHFMNIDIIYNAIVDFIKLYNDRERQTVNRES